MGRTLVSSLALAASLAVAPAHAQSTSPPTNDGSGADDVVVTARRESTARAEQQAAPNLVNIQSAETIAKYPDVNAAEAISRIPGVALSVDTGEGRFVNIRGIDGNLNGQTFGGVVLLNTQPGGTYFNASGRAVEFDTVPIGAIDRIVVTKTGLPDHEAEGIGGSIELQPRTAIGVTRPFADLTVGGGAQTFSGRPLVRDEVVIGAPLGHNRDGGSLLSFVATQFLYDDHRSFDDIEAAYVDAQPDTPDKVFDALELRKYDYRRKRFGYSGEVDFTPADGQRFYLRASSAGYNEHVNRNRIEIDGLGDTVTADPSDPNGFVAAGASDLKALRDEEETHRNVVYQAGGDNRLGGFHLDYFAAYSRATYLKHYDYNSTFGGPDGLTVAYDNTTSPDHPTLDVLTGPSLTDSANYALDSLSNAREYDRDREWSGAADVSHALGLVADDELKVGFKLRRREKTAQPLNFTYTYTGPAAGLANFANGATVDDFYGYIPFGDEISPEAVRTFVAANPSLFTENVARDTSRNAGGFFDDTENVSAGYAQYDGTFGRLGVLAGVRVEHTEAVYAGVAQITTDPPADDPEAAATVSYVPRAVGQSYTDAFPTVQLKYSFEPALILRATWSTGVARPGFFQTIQSSSIDPGAFTASTGNPGLKPTYGDNFDLSLERYLPGNGILSVGLFDKELRDYIATRTVRGPLAGYTGIFTQDSYDNVPHAHARGVEAAAVYRFRGLPGWLDGFGVDANGSYVDSAVTLRGGEGQVALPGTFKYTANAALFYEAHGLQLRGSTQYESAVLFGIGGDRSTDVFQDKRFTVDFEGSYQLTRRVSLYANAKNLTNEPLRFYERASDRPIQREFYDVTLEGGVKVRI